MTMNAKTGTKKQGRIGARTKVWDRQGLWGDHVIGDECTVGRPSRSATACASATAARSGPSPPSSRSPDVPGVISRPWKARPKALIPSTGIPPRRRRIQRARNGKVGPRHARGANRSATSGGEGEPRARRPRHRRRGIFGPCPPIPLPERSHPIFLDGRPSRPGPHPGGLTPTRPVHEQIRGRGSEGAHGLWGPNPGREALERKDRRSPHSLTPGRCLYSSQSNPVPGDDDPGGIRLDLLKSEEIEALINERKPLPDDHERRLRPVKKSGQ